MRLPIQITFRNMDTSPAIEARIRDRAEALDRFFPGIMACRVTVEAEAKGQRQGRLFHLGISLTVPGDEIVVNRRPASDHSHEDVAVAVRDAFDAARRQLEDYARRLQGETKSHVEPPHGRIARLFPDHGFILSSDGQEIYMHRNAVTGGRFDSLAEGDEVRFSLRQGEKGPQAGTVVPVGKHHPAPDRP